MKEEYFRVYFGKDDFVEVYALSFRDAAIFAMAERLKQIKIPRIDFIEGKKRTRDYRFECPLCGYAGQYQCDNTT